MGYFIPYKIVLCQLARGIASAFIGIFPQEFLRELHLVITFILVCSLHELLYVYNFIPDKVILHQPYLVLDQL